MYRENLRTTRMVWILGLVFGLMLAGSPALAGGGYHGFHGSPVGTWDAEVFPPEGEPFKSLLVFNARGTLQSSSSRDPELTAYGSWKRVERNRYIASFYILAVDEGGNQTGYVKGEQEFWMVDRNTQEGIGDLFFLVGTDPLNPDNVITIREGEKLFRRRLLP